jgi:hypothetical protein
MSIHWRKNIKAKSFLLLGTAYFLYLATGCSMWSKPSAGYTAAAKDSGQKEEAAAEVYPRNEIPPYVGHIRAVRVYSSYERIDTGVDLGRRLFFLSRVLCGRGVSGRRLGPHGAAGCQV